MKYILEDHTYSYYNNYPDSNVKPLSSTVLKPIDYEEFKKEHHKQNGKYSWAISPRYKRDVVEVGPIAKIINTYKRSSNEKLNDLVDKLNKELNITFKEYNSVMDGRLGTLPELDTSLRPLKFYARTIHERCIFYADFQDKSCFIVIWNKRRCKTYR